VGDRRVAAGSLEGGARGYGALVAGGAPLVLEKYRKDWDHQLAPVALRLHRLGVTPNLLTAAALLFALVAALAFGLASADRPWLLLAGAAAVGLNAVLDGLDGRLARLTNSATKRGDYLDHVVDRYADVAILLGLALSPLGSLRWGLFAIVGTFLTSYMGTQAQAIGLKRDYGGWLGRADRLVILTVVPALTFGALTLGLALPFDPITAMLVYFAIVGNITAIQRFWSGWRALGD
jgi:archaetidylinositol phosphate synthase